MTVEELKSEKTKLEHVIFKLLKKFHEETGYDITKIEVETTDSIIGRNPSKIWSVKVILTI